MADQTNDNQSGGATFKGPVTAGRDIAGRDIHSKNIQGPSPDQLKALLAPLHDAVNNSSLEKSKAADAMLENIEAEVAKGKEADDPLLAKLLEDFVSLIPEAASAVVSAFASPILGAIAGPVSQYVLSKLKL